LHQDLRPWVPSKYGPFQMSYNTTKDKWNVHELHSMLVKEEMRFKNQGNDSFCYVSHQGNQGVGKKFMKKHDKGIGPLKINDGPVQIHKKASKSNNGYFCGKSGHFQKDFLKRKSWFEKKGELNALLYFESNLTEVPHNTWQIDSGFTTHVSNTTQTFLTIQTISRNEKFVFMRNRVKALVKVVRIYCLKLDTEYHLNLLETLNVPSLSRNLVSLSKLHVTYTLLILVISVSISLSIIISLVLMFFVMVYINEIRWFVC